MTPRSCLRWKPTGKIFKIVGLRWVPTGKIFTSSTTKVDSEPTNGSNEDITNQYECEQTLDVSAGTLNLSAGTSFNPKKEGLRVCSELGIHDHNNEPSSSKLVPKVVPPADKTATSRQELELLFHHHITMLSSAAFSFPAAGTNRGCWDMGCLRVELLEDPPFEVGSFKMFAIWRCILMLNKGDASGKFYVVLKARHILCEKQIKINEAYKKLQDGWLSKGDKVPPAEFSKIFHMVNEMFLSQIEFRGCYVDLEVLDRSPCPYTHGGVVVTISLNYEDDNGNRGRDSETHNVRLSSQEQEMIEDYVRDVVDIRVDRALKDTMVISVPNLGGNGCSKSVMTDLRRGDLRACKDCRVFPGEACSSQHRLVALDALSDRQRHMRVMMGTPRIFRKNLYEDAVKTFRARVIDGLSARVGDLIVYDADQMWASLSHIIRDASKDAFGVDSGSTRTRSTRRESWWFSGEVQTKVAVKQNRFRELLLCGEGNQADRETTKESVSLKICRLIRNYISINR
ncbi:hypothetical protein Tco_1283087 [Tanacetum coccineum]